MAIGLITRLREILTICLSFLIKFNRMQVNFVAMHLRYGFEMSSFSLAMLHWKVKLKLKFLMTR